MKIMNEIKKEQEHTISYEGGSDSESEGEDLSSQ